MVASWMSRSAPAACVAALLESSSSRVSDRMTSLREVPLSTKSAGFSSLPSGSGMGVPCLKLRRTERGMPCWLGLGLGSGLGLGLGFRLELGLGLGFRLELLQVRVRVRVRAAGWACPA